MRGNSNTLAYPFESYAKRDEWLDVSPRTDNLNDYLQARRFDVRIAGLWCCLIP
jgi:hypothetical protein